MPLFDFASALSGAINTLNATVVTAIERNA
jgi:hypothetical protein